MAQIKIFYEPSVSLLTIFWQTPRKEQICTELDDGIILIKDSRTQEPIGLELLSYHPDDLRLGQVLVDIGQIESLPALV